MKRRKRTLIAVAVMTACLTAVSAGAADGGGVVNINTADAEQLMLLPRVGPTVAQRIIDHREKNGRFKAPEDLMMVRGIGEKTYQLIEPHVTVSGDTTLEEKVQVPKNGSPDS